ncbi:MAG: Gfo/Idh/MocA family oxidoreductase [Eubacteriales bacterium]|nr:Gfo/Idh/MocA family oxidoreductase [Eubacteriales bacterium]
MLEDTYAHSPLKKMFDNKDVYGIAYDEERSRKKEIRLAIIGCGGVAQSKHIPAIMRLRTIWEPVTLAAICMRNSVQGKKVAQTYGTKWYDDYRKMLEMEKPDGVLVLSPDSLHYEHAMACLERGIHVLAEKPVTDSLAKAAELVAYAKQKKLVFMTVSNKRYSPPYFRAKKYGIPNPAMFVGKFNLGYDYVDILEGGTVHIFDLARYFMGDVKALTAIATRHYSFNKTGYLFDHACINLEFLSGAIGQIYTSSSALSLKPWERVEIYGEKQWLAIEDQHTLKIYDSEEGPTKIYEPVFPNTLIFDEEFGGFMGLIENFCECIRGNAEPLVTGWDGMKAYELVLAVHRSIQEKRRVELPLIE